MIEIEIPSRGRLRLEHAVFDVNGTLAVDGQLLTGVSERLAQLQAQLDVVLISADTHGTLDQLAGELDVRAVRLRPGDEAAQKAAFVAEFGAEQVVAFGNGANDVGMFQQAALSIAVLGGEGLAQRCLLSADILAPDILAGLDLLLKPRRLLATLRA
jgi:P-type E1-E2 ATPase